MKKPVKTIGKILLWTVGVIVALVLLLPVWIGPTTRLLTWAVVPSITGTPFHLGEFGLNQYNGRLSVGDMQLGNPEGFDQKQAFTLGQMSVDVDMGSVMSDTIVVEEILIKDVFVSYVSNKQGENNFAVIGRKASGGKDKPKAADEKKDDADGKPKKKVIIDHLRIENVVVQFGPLTVPLKVAIDMKGIGRESKGVSFEEAWDAIWKKIVESFGAVGANLTNLAGSIGDASAKHAKQAVKGMGDAVKGGTGLVTDAAGKTVDAVGKGTGKAVDAVSEGTGKAIDAVKGLFK